MSFFRCVGADAVEAALAERSEAISLTQYVLDFRSSYGTRLKVDVKTEKRSRIRRLGMSWHGFICLHPHTINNLLNKRGHMVA